MKYSSVLWITQGLDRLREGHDRAIRMRDAMQITSRVSDTTPSSYLVAPGFGRVADAFFKSIDQEHSGAALSVWLEGTPVVELWAGIADARDGRPFDADTLVPVFSCTKGMASLVVAMLVQQRLLPSYETPMAEIWPEFGAHGKDLVTIGDALAHRAGLSAPRLDLSPDQVLDPLKMAEVLAAQEPLWEPSTTHQYHGITHGALTAKLVHLATGTTIGAYFAEQVAEPLGLDVWIGLPLNEHSRVARLLPDQDVLPPQEEADPEAEYWLERAGSLGGYLTPERWTEPYIWEAQIPGAGGIATATGLAKMWSSTVVSTGGVRTLNDVSVENLRRQRSEGPPLFAGPPPYQAWGAGVMVPSDWEPYLTPTSFGHDGAGGQVAFADPTLKVGFGYVVNQMGSWERGQSVISALANVIR